MALKFGKIKLMAHRLLRREPIPLMRDNQDNRAINAHGHRVLDARTKRQHDRKDRHGEQRRREEGG